MSLSREMKFCIILYGNYKLFKMIVHSKHNIGSGRKEGNVIMIKRLNSNNEIFDRFIAPIHYDGLINYMNNNRMIVAFRPTGMYSIDKLTLGAAAKPHAILDKTIKPYEVGVDSPVLFNGMNIKLDTIDKAKSALCGLVGKRDKYGHLVGVFLSSIGMMFFNDPIMQLYIHNVDKTNQGYVAFEKIDMLLAWIISIYDILGESIFKFFIAGDYDMNEVLQVKLNGKIEHILAETEAESSMLYGMSRAAVGKPIIATQVERFEPLEFSPIQHGVQDKPALDIAFYNGIDNSWTIINNMREEKSVYIEACVKQCEDIREYLGLWGTDMTEYWKINGDNVALAKLLNNSGRNFFV